MRVLETPLAGDIDATKEKSKYDAQVKKALSNRIILVCILKYTVKEFFDYSITEIEKCIEGTPEVAKVSVDTGLSNKSIGDMNTEDAIPNEGRIAYDIKFYVILPDGEHTKIIINIEA